MPSLYDELRAIAAEETSRAVGFRVKGDDYGVGPVVSRIIDRLYDPTAAMLAAGERAWMNRNLNDPHSEPMTDCWCAMLGAIKEPSE